MSATPTLADLIDRSIAAGLARLHVAMPGKVITYSSSRNTVDVEPQFKTPIENEDGTFTFEALPIIPDVPIMWPSGKGGSCFMTWPLEAGDFVELVFNDYDPGIWRTQGEKGNPGDLRKGGIGGAVAWPGMRTNAGKLPSSKIHATKVVIGEAVLLGSAAAAKSIPLGEDLVSWLNGHTHTSGGSGSPTTTPIVPATSAILSTKHKVDS